MTAHTALATTVAPLVASLAAFPLAYMLGRRKGAGHAAPWSWKTWLRLAFGATGLSPADMIPRGAFAAFGMYATVMLLIGGEAARQGNDIVATMAAASTWGMMGLALLVIAYTGVVYANKTESVIDQTRDAA